MREEAIRSAQERAAKQAEADRKALEDIVRKMQENPQAASTDIGETKLPEPALPDAVTPLPAPETPSSDIFGPPPPDAKPPAEQTGAVEPQDVEIMKPPAPKSKPKRQQPKTQARTDPGAPLVLVPPQKIAKEPPKRENFLDRLFRRLKSQN